MLHEAGAVGEISYRFYDRQENRSKRHLTTASSAFRWKSCARPTASWRSPAENRKPRPSLAPWKLGVIDVLVTDKFTAARLTA